MKVERLKVFKEISVGGTSKVQLINRLVEAGIQFNKYAHILFEHPTFIPPIQVENVKLVKVSLSELSMQSPCSFSEIVMNASKLELKLCPLYLAAFLRTEYLDQPDGPYLTIASPLPEKDENYPNGFYLRNIDNAL